MNHACVMRPTQDSPSRPIRPPRGRPPAAAVRSHFLGEGPVTPRALLLVGLALTTPGRAQAQALGQIQGTVTGEPGRPLAGATVTVVGAGRSTTSREDGSYTISAISPGTYQVRAKLIGYAQITQPVTVAADAVATVDFR